MQATPPQQIHAWLQALMDAGLPLHRLQRWSSVPSVASLQAGCGKRVVWTPEDGNARVHREVLEAIGRKMLPVKLILPDQHDLDWCSWNSLPGWWIAAPSSYQEARALLWRSLADEWPTLIVAPEQWLSICDPGCFEWGRLCAEPEEPVWLLCAQEAVGLATEAEALLTAHGIPAALVPCSSIRPLPVAQVRRNATQLVICLDQGSTQRGLGALWQRVHPAIDISYCGAEQRLGTPPQPADIMVMVRMQLGL